MALCIFIVTAKSIVFNFETTNNGLLKSSWEQEVSLIMNIKSTTLALISRAYYLLNTTTVASLYEPQTNIVTSTLRHFSKYQQHKCLDENLGILP